MTTYWNAYEILSQVRYDLNEYSTAYMQGSDTTGAFQNVQLMAKINQAQRMIWNVLFAQIPEEFLKSATLTFSSSVATLPADFYRIKRLEDSDGIKVERISLDGKHTNDDSGTEFLYYRYGQSIKIDKDSISDSHTLWYYSKPRELDQGMSSAGSTLALTLATSAKKITDYYNGMTIEDITDDWVDTINDYTSARVCTLAVQTGAASKYYGIISELPEPFHHLIQPKATILCKSLPNSPEKPAIIELQDFNDMLRETLRGYAGTNFTDVTMEEIVNDFVPY